jgi:hypothetical protein
VSDHFPLISAGWAPLIIYASDPFEILVEWYVSETELRQATCIGPAEVILANRLREFLGGRRGIEPCRLAASVGGVHRWLWVRSTIQQGRSISLTAGAASRFREICYPVLLVYDTIFHPVVEWVSNSLVRAGLPR